MVTLREGFTEEEGAQGDSRVLSCSDSRLGTVTQVYVVCEILRAIHLAYVHSPVWRNQCTSPFLNTCNVQRSCCSVCSEWSIWVKSVPLS